MKLQRVLAVIGAGVLLFAASDAITYAATGSSLVLGVINHATSLTTIQNTGPGSALRLVTSSGATPPLVVNGKGKVANLYSDRAATADNATKLGGLTPAQVESAAVQHVTPARIVWVAKSGGNFTSVKAALASIHDNSAALPYLIKIAPGTYTETGGVTLKDHVDLEGSGEDNTIITCACGSPTSPYTDGSSATVRIVGPFITTELRDLAVVNTGPDVYSTAVWNSGGTGFGSVVIRNVAIRVQGGVGNYGVVNTGSSVWISDSTITATGGSSSSEVFGVANVDGAGIAIRNVVVRTSGSGTSRVAVHNNKSNFEADSSALNANDIGIDNVNAAAYVSNSSVSPSAVGTPSSFNCVGDFTALYVPLSPTCGA
jgi:hypothetical protein